MSKVWTIIGIIVLIAIGYFFFQQYKYVIVDNPYANPCAPELKEAEACTMEHEPVCGISNPKFFRCVTGKCTDTYTNACVACQDPKIEYWIAGRCLI